MTITNLRKLSFLVLLVLVLSKTEQCMCHVGNGQSVSFGLQMTTGITGWAKNKRRCSTNPVVLGIQRALYQSSLPVSGTPDRNKKSSSLSSALSTSLSTLTASSTKYVQETEELVDLHPTRFACIQPKEAQEITVTMKPHLKQKRAVFNPRHDDDDDEESLLSDLALDERNIAEEEKMIPCTVTQPAALQGKFRPQNPRRLTPSSATATAAIDAAKSSSPSTRSRGGNAAAAAVAAAAAHRPLMFWENMVSGAVSRSVAQTVMHPANTMKTILQSSRDTTFTELLHPKMFRRLTVGAGANFVLSIPHGAVNFAVLEFVRGRLNLLIDSVPFLDKRKGAMGPGLDFLSSAISTICCSVVSTPQMMITDVCHT
jgi:hypothetical protein